MIKNEPDAPTGVLDELPAFELECLVDDEIDPTEVTIFSPDVDEITTRWISVDVDSAVPLDAIR